MLLARGCHIGPPCRSGCRRTWYGCTRPQSELVGMPYCTQAARQSRTRLKLDSSGTAAHRMHSQGPVEAVVDPAYINHQHLVAPRSHCADQNCKAAAAVRLLHSSPVQACLSARPVSTRRRPNQPARADAMQCMQQASLDVLQAQQDHADSQQRCSLAPELVQKVASAQGAACAPSGTRAPGRGCPHAVEAHIHL